MSDLRFVRYPDRASWLESRRFSIGSSDAPALMGESSWASPVSLNYSKRALTPALDPDVDPDRELELEWHRRREDEIASWWWTHLQPQAPELFWKRQGIEVVLWDPGDYTVAVREVDGIPLSATYDRLLLRRTDDALRATNNIVWYYPLGSSDWPIENDWRIVAESVVAPVELKNAAAWMQRHWQEEPPLIYSLQLQHQLMVAGVKPGYMVASIGGQPPVWCEQFRDGEVCSHLRSAYRRFWDSVIENRDLYADYKDVTSRAIAARYSKDDGSTIKLGEEAAGWWRQYRNELESAKTHEQAKEEAANNLKQAMGEALFGVFPDDTTISLKGDKNGRRRLRLVGDDLGAAEPDPWKGF